MKSYYFYRRKFIVCQKEDVNENIIYKKIIPYDPELFKSVLIKAISYKSVNLMIRERYNDEDEYGDSDPTREFHDSIHYSLNSNSSERLVRIALIENERYHNIVFDNLKDIDTITIDSEKTFANYNWIDNVKFIKLDAFTKCTPEIFNSGKLLQTPYEHWMDVEKYPDIDYIVTKDMNDINPQIRNLNVSLRHKESIINILVQLKKFKNLNNLTVKTNSTNDDIIGHFWHINCNELYFYIDKLDDIVAMNKYKCIKSIYYCKKETVAKNSTLIDGWFSIEDGGIKMNFVDSMKYLGTIFKRNIMLSNFATNYITSVSVEF